MYTATITNQGQITIPAEARRRVGFKPGDKLFVDPQDGELRIKRYEGLEALRGIFAQAAVGKPKLTSKRLEQLREVFYTERYKRFLKQQNEKSNS